MYIHTLEYYIAIEKNREGFINVNFIYILI